jgi:hypothetical protein
MSKINLWELKKLEEEGKSPEEITRHIGVSLSAYYRARKKLVRLTVPPSVQALTPKQRKFLELKSSGLSQTESALQAYDCETRKSAREIGSQLMKAPEITAAMSDWLQYVGMGRPRRAERLAEICENPDAQIALGGLKEALKCGGDYPPQRVQVEEETVQYVVSFTPDPNDGKIMGMGAPYEIDAKQITRELGKELSQDDDGDHE